MKRILTFILLLAFLASFSVGVSIDVSFAGEGDAKEINIDIKPGACPNYFNIKSRGFIQVAVLGTQDFDVSTIDADDTFLCMEEGEGKVAPVKWTYEDVATPIYEKQNACDCNNLDGDGYIDLILKFDAQELVGTLELAEYINQTILLTIMGEVEINNNEGDEENDEDEEDEDKIIGRDCVFITDQKPVVGNFQKGWLR